MKKLRKQTKEAQVIFAVMTMTSVEFTTLEVATRAEVNKSTAIKWLRKMESDNLITSRWKTYSKWNGLTLWKRK